MGFSSVTVFAGAAAFMGFFAGAVLVADLLTAFLAGTFVIVFFAVAMGSNVLGDKRKARSSRAAAF